MSTTMRYSEDQKKAALRTYVDYGRNLAKTADETGIPYNSMRPWIASDWGKMFLANYELESRQNMVATATQEMLDMKVKHFQIETDFYVELEKIMGNVIKRLNELLGQEKNVKHLNDLLKTLYDVMTQFREKSELKNYGIDEKTRTMVKLIEKEMVVVPTCITELIPKKDIINLNDDEL